LKLACLRLSAIDLEHPDLGRLELKT